MPKINCNVTINFLNEWGRMCDHHECEVCAFYNDNNHQEMSCDEFVTHCPEDAIEIVQKWSDAHPPKTMLEDFLEKYPDAPLTEFKIPEMCPHKLGYAKLTSSICRSNLTNCKSCWNRPLEKDDKK